MLCNSVDVETTSILLLDYLHCIFTFSSGKTIFPEITLCPKWLPMSHNWELLCNKYNICYNDESLENFNNEIPQDPKFSQLSLSNYFQDITYRLNDLISAYTVTTINKNLKTNET